MSGIACVCGVVSSVLCRRSGIVCGGDDVLALCRRSAILCTLRRVGGGFGCRSGFSQLGGTLRGHGLFFCYRGLLDRGLSGGRLFSRGCGHGLFGLGRCGRSFKVSNNKGE